MFLAFQNHAYGSGGGNGGSGGNIGDTHAVPAATHWRAVFWGSANSVYTSAAEMDFLDGSDVSLTSGSGGTVIWSDQRGGSFLATNLFDGVVSTEWSITKKYGEYVGFVFPSAVTPAKLSLTARNDSSYGHAPTVIGVECSQDAGTTWELVEAFHVPQTGAWAKGETKTFTLGAGAYAFENTRSGFATSYGHETMGTTYVAEQDFTLETIKFRIAFTRLIRIAIAALDGTGAISEILETWVAPSALPNGENEITLDNPVTFSAGQDFAIIAYSDASEANRDPRVNYISDDYYPLVATQTGVFYQAVTDISVGASDEGLQTQVPMFFFAGEWDNGLGT